MATPAVPNPKDALYHMLRVTGTYQAFQRAMSDAVTRSAEARKARDKQRQRETTYARGVLGGH